MAKIGVTGLGFGVWSLARAEERRDFGFLTSNLIPLFHLILRSRAWTRPWRAGEEHREYEIKREDETRTGLGFGV